MTENPVASSPMPARPKPVESLSGQIDIQGRSLAYEASGRGDPVVFIHSVLVDSRMWDREFAGAARQHRAVRFDLPGFGRSAPASAPFSYVADLDALRRHLDLPPAVLVGSSMGGAVAIDYALEHPDRVRGLFLAAPGLSGGIPPPFDRTEQDALDFDDQKSREILQAWKAGNRTLAIDLLRQLWCSQLQGPALQSFRAMVDQNATEVFESPSDKFSEGTPAAPRLGSLRVPTTVLAGDRDNPSSPVFARRIAGAIPGARLVTVPGADHLVNLSRPGPFDRELAAALKAPSP